MTYVIREYEIRPEFDDKPRTGTSRGANTVLREREFKTMDELAKYKAAHELGDDAVRQANKAAGQVETHRTQLEVMKREGGMLNALSTAENNALASEVDAVKKKGIPSVLKGLATAAKESEVAGHLLGAMRKIPGLNKIAAGVTLAAGAVGAASAKTPEERKGALKDTFKGVVGVFDPTMGILSEGVPAAIEDLREKGAQRHAESRTNPQRLAMVSEQKFIFGPDHPGQLGALKMKDKDGKEVDVQAALKDPARRDSVMGEIDRRLNEAQNRDAKQLYGDMKDAATTFTSLEDRLKPLQPNTQVAKAAPTTAPQLAMT